MKLFKVIRYACLVFAFCSLARAQSPVNIIDTSGDIAAVAPANTPPALADKTLEVSLSPNNGGLPVNLITSVQSRATASSGSVASLPLAYTSNVTKGNSEVVSFCNGNINAPTGPITSTLFPSASSWTKANHFASAALECDIWFAVNSPGGADTVTVTPGGTNASVGMTIYELSGPIQLSVAQPAGFTAQTGSGSSATATTSVTMSPLAPNSFAIAAIGLGTPTAQTITPASGWTNDSGQQNPATPSVLFSFVSMSQFLDNLASLTPTATFTSAPWVIVSAAFKPVHFPIEGTVKLYDGTNLVNVTSLNSIKTDITTVAGTAVSTATAGVQLVGVEGRAGTSFETTAGVLDENIKNIGNSAVSTAATGVQKVGVVGNAGSSVDATLAAGTAPTDGIGILGQFNTALPTLTAAQTASLQVDANGLLLSTPAVTTSVNVGMSASTKATVTTAVNVKSTPGNVYGVFFLNGAVAGCWIELINSATGTLGTAVIANIPMASAGSQLLMFSPPLGGFTAGIAVGSATAAGGASACGTAATGIVVLFK